MHWLICAYVQFHHWDSILIALRYNYEKFQIKIYCFFILLQIKKDSYKTLLNYFQRYFLFFLGKWQSMQVLLTCGRDVQRKSHGLVSTSWKKQGHLKTIIRTMRACLIAALPFARIGLLLSHNDCNVLLWLQIMIRHKCILIRPHYHP